MEVVIKIKGTTSRYAITTTYEYSSFKVKFNFDKAHKDQTLLGLETLTLNSMSQDSSKIHETFAYQAYREMGVPASRTGYTHLTLSKNIPKPDRGLFLTLESLDDVFLGNNFKDVPQHLYENNHNFNEITPANIGDNKKITPRFQVKEGWKSTPSKDDLRAFAKGIQKVSQWATETKLTDQMKATVRLIKSYSNAHTRAEQKRTIAWVDKQLDNVLNAVF